MLSVMSFGQTVPGFGMSGNSPQISNSSYMYSQNDGSNPGQQMVQMHMGGMNSNMPWGNFQAGGYMFDPRGAAYQMAQFQLQVPGYGSYPWMPSMSGGYGPSQVPDGNGAGNVQQMSYSNGSNNMYKVEPPLSNGGNSSSIY